MGQGSCLGAIRLLTGARAGLDVRPASTTRFQRLPRLADEALRIVLAYFWASTSLLSQGEPDAAASHAQAELASAEKLRDRHRLAMAVPFKRAFGLA